MNSPLDRFMSNFDTPERCQRNSESVHALAEQINAGAPIPPVSANDVKQIWHAMREMNAERPPRSGFAIGLSVYAGYGVDCAAEPTRFFAAQWRHKVLLDLIERGVLSQWVLDGEPDDKVFEAAATMHCTLKDLGRAVHKAIAQSEAELASDASEAAGAGSVMEKTMDQAELIAEHEAHIQTLKDLVEARTQQLKQAVGTHEKLMHDVGDAIPALRKADAAVKNDPAVKKLLEQFAWIGK